MVTVEARGLIDNKMGDWKSLPRELSFCVERWQEHWGVQVKVLLKLENRVAKTSFAKLSPFKQSSWSSQSAQHFHIQEASEQGSDWWLCPSLADPWFIEHYIHSRSSLLRWLTLLAIFKSKGDPIRKTSLSAVNGLGLCDDTFFPYCQLDGI